MVPFLAQNCQNKGRSRIQTSAHARKRISERLVERRPESKKRSGWIEYFSLGQKYSKLVTLGRQAGDRPEMGADCLDHQRTN